ncbi:hypothetical protein [Aureispira anguillae]|uniref:PsbP C-terminal domain-containing protein n=1 Tax=Aureispira anguillae TaxID=2864201 RepID=A0A916DRV9_9BACT|nr:hypothetical protein [Aureispira anguillae]BDS10436.1 hypothetical protein AsAng_0011440 [Aureispira anguillae]
MKKIILLAILLISSLQCSFGQERQVNQPPKKNKNWVIDENASYYIEYPKEWKIDKSGTMGTSLILFSPITSSEDSFSENVNLMIQDLGGMDINLDEFVELSEKQVKTLITDGNIELSKRINASNGTFHKIIYTGKQGILKLKFEQYYWMVDEKAYILTLTCGDDTFEEFQIAGEKILDSFRIK